MAKVSPVSIKYMIHASFKAEGPLEKPDVIGALFGQTEGLLGEDMEMRELQKEGRIGRIEVELELVDGKTVGEIKLPSALDKSETTLIAAALETIDRIGPTEAQNRVNNVIGMNGTKLPKEIAKLGETKEITLFVDGDRGGKLIAGNVISNANIAYVAVAPDGKEVEELQGKEILMSLRKKVGVKDFLRMLKYSGTNGNGAGYVRESDRAADREERAVEKSVEKPVEKEVEFVGDAKAKVRETYEKIRGSKNAILVDIKFDIIRKVSPRDVPRALDYSRQKVFAVIIDGPATSGIIRSCDDFAVKHLGATQFSAVENTKVNLISL